MIWTEIETTILVHSSWVERAGVEGYRFWDIQRVIPRPADGVLTAQILLPSGWEEMHFNRVWGKGYDPVGEGTWLKQKRTKHFNVPTGQHRYRVRYRMVMPRPA